MLGGIQFTDTFGNARLYVIDGNGVNLGPETAEWLHGGSALTTLTPDQVKYHLANMMAGARLSQAHFEAGMPDNWRVWWDGLTAHERHAIYNGATNLTATMGFPLL